MSVCGRIDGLVIFRGLASTHLSSFRNDYLEHRKKDNSEFAAYYQPETAEMLFDHAWRTMADLFPAFIEARYLPTWSIMEIPMDERDPKHLRR